MEEITAPVILTRQRIALCHRVQVSNLDVTKCLRIIKIIYNKEPDCADEMFFVLKAAPEYKRDFVICVES